MKCWHILELSIWTSVVEGEEKSIEHEALGKMKVCINNKIKWKLEIKLKIVHMKSLASLGIEPKGRGGTISAKLYTMKC